MKMGRAKEENPNGVLLRTTKVLSVGKYFRLRSGMEVLMGIAGRGPSGVWGPRPGKSMMGDGGRRLGRRMNAGPGYGCLLPVLIIVIVGSIAAIARGSIGAKLLGLLLLLGVGSVLLYRLRKARKPPGDC